MQIFCFQKPPEQERKSSLKKKKEDGVLASLKIEASKVKTCYMSHFSYSCKIE